MSEHALSPLAHAVSYPGSPTISRRLMTSKSPPAQHPATAAAGTAVLAEPPAGAGGWSPRTRILRFDVESTASARRRNPALASPSTLGGVAATVGGLSSLVLGPSVATRPHAMPHAATRAEPTTEPTATSPTATSPPAVVTAAGAGDAEAKPATKWSWWSYLLGTAPGLAAAAAAEAGGPCPAGGEFVCSVLRGASQVMSLCLTSDTPAPNTCCNRNCDA